MTVALKEVSTLNSYMAVANRNSESSGKFQVATCTGLELLDFLK